MRAVRNQDFGRIQAKRTLLHVPSAYPMRYAWWSPILRIAMIPSRGLRCGRHGARWRLGLARMQNCKEVSWNSSISPIAARSRSGFPHDFFTWLRRNEPVWWHEPTQFTPNGVGFWVVSRYDDVVAVFKDPETYSSELGGTQIYDGKGMGYQLNQTDDPKHRRLRALVNKGFTPRMIGRWRTSYEHAPNASSTAYRWRRLSTSFHPWPGSSRSRRSVACSECPRKIGRR